MINLPERFKDASIKDWDTDHVFRIASTKYVKNLEFNLVNGIAPSFFGVSGTGKSRIAAAILNTVVGVTTPQIKVSWFPTSEAFNKLLDYRDLHMTDNYNFLWDRMKSDPLVVFDDIGTLRDSPRVMEYFWMILDSRYADQKSTIFTGNLAGNINNRQDLLEHVSRWISPAFTRRLDQFSSEYLVLV